MGFEMADLAIIVAVMFMDALLSIDNALVLAAMVMHLPVKQRTWALRAGMLGAYVLRGGSLLLVSFIIANPWLKIAGALYLVYLMAEKLGVGGADGDEKKKVQAGFWGTVIAVELADLSFSLDNIVAAVAFSPKFYIVVIGVFASILAMRFVAGYFVKAIERWPVLGNIAYVLVGYLGLQLAAEQVFHFEVHGLQKVGGLLAIIALGFVYDNSPFLKRNLKPLVWVATRLMYVFALVMGTLVVTPVSWVLGKVFWPVKKLFGKLSDMMGIKVENVEEEAPATEAVATTEGATSPGTQKPSA